MSAFEPPEPCASRLYPCLPVFIRGKKTKTPPPSGSGVQESQVIELEPARQAAPQQRVRQQLKAQCAIHADTGSRFRSTSQFVFCCSLMAGLCRAAGGNTSHFLKHQHFA